MKNKMDIILGIGVVLAVLIILYFYLSAAGTLNVFDAVFTVLILIMIIAITWILLKRSSNIRKGLPVKDELAIKVNYRAGSYAFIASIWISVGLIWLSIFLEEAGYAGFGVIEALGSVILLTGLVWIVSYFILNRRGDV